MADRLSRRAALGRLARGVAAGLIATPPIGLHLQRSSLTRRIPSSGEEIPVIGLGSWITFNVGDDRAARDECATVIRAFFESGGKVIDSSPMYGSSQSVIGHGLAKLRPVPALFAADK